MLHGEEARNVLTVVVDEIVDAEKDLGALREGDRAPGCERLPRGLDRGVDLFRRREVDGAGLTAERGVVDRAAAPRRAFDDTAADPVADPLDVLFPLHRRRG